MKDRTSAPQPCPLCHGSGQNSSFKGVSRFLLTTEECPACAGTGLDLDDRSQTAETPQPNGRRDK